MDKRERATKTSLALVVVFTIIFSGLAMIGGLQYDHDVHVTKVACVGDSITMGSTYPDKLQVMLGSYYSVKNFGLSSSTVSMESKLPYMSQAPFQRAKDFQPDIVLILLGTNDANPEVTYNETTFEDDYATLVTSFMQLDSKPQVVVVNSPPIFVSETSPYNNTYLTKNLIPQMNDIADRYNLPTVDLYGVFGDHPEYFMDGIHPTDQGTNLIAQTLCQTVTDIKDNSP